MSTPQQAEVLKILADIFDDLNIRYAIGGSVASSIFGTPRFTQDADITVQLSIQEAESLYEKLTGHFYISKEAMYQAVNSKSCFNIIHLDTVFKIDIFIPNGEFENIIIARSHKDKINEFTAKEFSLVSPEDVILLKLKWYKMADCASDRQWSDIKGVLTVQKNKIDYDYLKIWAAKLGLANLLEKAISEANIKE
jgi:arginine deiminase